MLAEPAEVEFSVRVISCDWNGDGLVDIVSTSQRGTYWYHRTYVDGIPVLTEKTLVDRGGVDVVLPSTGMVCRDMDMDGRPDLVTADTSTIRLHHNIGANQAATTVVGYCWWCGDYNKAYVVVTDCDNDDWPDIVFFDTDQQLLDRLQWARNLGSLAFAPQVPTMTLTQILERSSPRDSAGSDTNARDRGKVPGHLHHRHRR